MPPHPSKGRGAHLTTHGFSSIAFRSAGVLRLCAFEALRRSHLWRGVVRAKGFLVFAESAGYRLTVQQTGGRIDVTLSSGAVAATALDDDCHCVLVLIGQKLEAEALLRALQRCEHEVAAPGECAPCDDDGGAVGGVAGDDAASSGVAGESTANLAAVGAALAERIRRDPRFDAESVRVLDGGRLVRFRLHGWLGVDREELNRELLDAVNTGAASGHAWLAPYRGWPDADAGGGGGGCSGGMQLLQPLCAGDDARLVWRTLYDATESVMAAHFAALYCGGCDCLDKLAGQALT